MSNPDKWKESRRLGQRRWRAKNKLKTRAHEVANAAVRKGEIQRLPCFLCGEIKVEGHHINYNFPEKVIWLCIKHHKDIHRQTKLEQPYEPKYYTLGLVKDGKKRCSHCKEWKEFTEFGPWGPSRPGSLQSWCKVCQRNRFKKQL